MGFSNNTVWWQVYPLGFCGAPLHDYDPAMTCRLDRLTGWLDYAVDLGATGLALGPLFASETHGYDTLDHYRVDSRLGDDAAFDRLVAGCRDRGLPILLDGVFNHVGANHPWLRQALSEGPGGHFAHFFRIDWSDPWQPRCHTFEGHGGLVALNHDNPAVADYVVDVMRYWLGRGAAGWRLDAAYTMHPSFWARVLPRVRDAFGDAWFVGEVIHGDYPTIVRASGLNSVTQYELWKASWSSMLDRNFFELDWCLQRHNRLLNTCSPLTFIGNHDVTRPASKLGDQRTVLALVVLLTVGGIPSIYYGDEQAFRGIKGIGWNADDAIRPAFPDNPDELAPDGWWMFHLHQHLIGLRRQRPWLTTARTQTVQLTNTRYVYQSFSADHNRAITVELDVTASPSAIIRDEDHVLFSYGS